MATKGQSPNQEGAKTIKVAAQLGGEKEAFPSRASASTRWLVHALLFLARPCVLQLKTQNPPQKKKPPGNCFAKKFDVCVGCADDPQPVEILRAIERFKSEEHMMVATFLFGNLPNSHDPH